ncbi:MAG TPA: bifunctional DNA-formamidopyrimidine glycosylase/DNA-(apurinic or apyrimidinic site) lyase [Clostridia bacterium]|nr:bifunctional DNA-formamidopyrimidine glycosylase/DNA-(apurinic or apyrimidinic site) lyase [Clostridia bacterium]
MPELPEVEVQVRHLRPLITGRTITGVLVSRPKTLGPTSVRAFKNKLLGARFLALTRKGKFLLFSLLGAKTEPITLLGHLGMTGRMYLQPKSDPLPKHAPVVLDLGSELFVFEDPRYFGRLTLQTNALARLGPEPLSPEFNPPAFHAQLKRSRQPIKVKLLDQSLLAGVGNIYASEALFRAGISPRQTARTLNARQAAALANAIKQVLHEAILAGSTVSLNFPGRGNHDGLFYFGSTADTPKNYTERLQVYDRAGAPCPRCGGVIKRIVQAARSTYFCPECQRPQKFAKTADSV